jgi:hypothetical protein
MRPVHRREVAIFVVPMLAALITFFSAVRDAGAVPAFARKYQTSCLTCHTVFPVLNPFGEAFRRNGYRFPSQNGSVDSDAAKSPMIALGQEEYKKSFPNSVWPSNIPDSIPLSVMFNGAVTMNIPGSDAHDAAGNTFTWDGLVGEIHLFGAGALSDTVTYMAQLTLTQAGDAPIQGDLETAYLLWNDIVGPSHAVNLWIGRLFAPQLTSFGLHSDYLTDTRMPGVSVIGLYNSSGAFALGAGTTHSDGVELNGIVNHRYAYSLGWVASSTASGLNALNAENAYVHVGVKSGGVALDGEGKYGPNVPDPAKPWAEKALTFDVFGYHGLNVLDNGTGTVAGGTAVPVAQQDKYNAAGATLRAQYDSLQLDIGGQYEYHARPYVGSAATATPSGTTIPGAPDFTSAQGVVTWGELDYVIWPWFVPGVRAEYTVGNAEGSTAFSLLRVIPGIAMLVRPDVRVIVTGDLENARGAPVAGSWAPAGGSINGQPAGATSFQAETISAVGAVAF